MSKAIICDICGNKIGRGLFVKRYSIKMTMPVDRERRTFDICTRCYNLMEKWIREQIEEGEENE